MNLVSESMSYFVGGATLLAIFQLLFTDEALKYLWGLVNASQLMAVMPLIDVPVPSNVMIIFRFMAFANGEFQILKFLPNVFRDS